jgi:hypothetical protein
VVVLVSPLTWTETAGGSGTLNPVGWWLNVPANTLAGTYTSTITLAIADAP